MRTKKEQDVSEIARIIRDAGMYNRAGRLERVAAYLVAGLSIRHSADIEEVHRDTAMRVAHLLVKNGYELRCECGIETLRHPAICRIRFQKNPKRQIWMRDRWYPNLEIKNPVIVLPKVVTSNEMLALNRPRTGRKATNEQRGRARCPAPQSDKK